MAYATGMRLSNFICSLLLVVPLSTAAAELASAQSTAPADTPTASNPPSNAINPAAGTPPPTHTNPTPPSPLTVSVVIPSVAGPRLADPDPTRLRFGFSVGPALLVDPSSTGLGGAIALRAGVQFNQWVAVYAQAHGLVGAWVGGVAEAIGAGVFGGVLTSGLVEVTLPFVQLGFGPSVDFLGIAACVQAGGMSACGSTDVVYFGLDGRVALVLGGVGQGSRGGVSVNATIHPTFAGGDVLLTFVLGVGFEIY